MKKWLKSQKYVGEPTHRLSNSQIYWVWVAIRERCYNKNYRSYKYYGKKGIKMCKEWKNGKSAFINFYKWSLENGYKEEKLPSGRNKYTIDRIDTTKGYSPDNCHWVDYRTQNCNHIKLTNNKSGYRGVSWCRRDKVWVCVISIDNKLKRIGQYKTQKEAVKARNKFIDDNNLPNQKNVYIGELSYGY